MKKTLIALLLLLVPASSLKSQETDLGLRSNTGLVVSGSDVASDLSAAVLGRGGNAVDAAVANAFAMAVTYPFAGNLGGGGFTVVRTPDGKSTTFDYREVAPGKATPTMYLGADGNIDIRLTSTGYLAPGVPGTVRGMALAHKRFGKLAWKDVVTPAAELAAKGFKISKSLADSLNGELGLSDSGRGGGMKPYPASMAAYGKPGGKPWVAGDTIVQPDLARTLSAIAADGPDAFYTGWIADRISEDMAAHGGLITKADLAGYAAKEREPVKGTFLGYEIIAMPPPSSGGVALVEMLNMLEALEIQKKPHGSVDAMHAMIEAMRRGYLDRARFLGDPDFVKVPVADLTSKSHAKDMLKTFDAKRASSSVDLGADIVSKAAYPESDDTTHFVVLDRDGMAVSNTYTLEGGYGSHVVIAGTGVLLNNEMGDFNKKPGTTDLRGNIGTPPNVIAPGKRMLSSMTPVIVTKNGKVALVTGSPGGRTIINTVLDVVLNVTAYGMSGRDAVDGPRMHHQWLPDSTTVEENGSSEAKLASLRLLGHTIEMRGVQGSAQTIWIQPETGFAFGVADRRSVTSKASRPEK